LNDNKVYVEVIVKFSTEGAMMPIEFIWEDGTKYLIDKVKSKERCASRKAGGSYIGDMMIEEAPEEIKNFRLDPFEMKVQGLDRTLVDKVFAICDYYMQDRVKKHSWHV